MVREAVHTMAEHALKYVGMRQLGTFRKPSVIGYGQSVGYEK